MQNLLGSNRRSILIISALLLLVIITKNFVVSCIKAQESKERMKYEETVDLMEHVFDEIEDKGLSKIYLDAWGRELSISIRNGDVYLRSDGSNENDSRDDIFYNRVYHREADGVGYNQELDYFYKGVHVGGGVSAD